MQSDDRVIFMSRHYYIPQDDDDNGEYQDKFDSILEGLTMRKRVKYSTPLTSKSLRQSMASRCAQNKQFPNSMSDKYHHRRALPKKLVHYCFKSRYASFPSVQTACNYAA